MTRPRIRSLVSLALVAPVFVVFFVVHAQQPSSKAAPKAATAPAAKKAATPAPSPETAQKITNAMSAGPSAISKNATLMDWPDMMKDPNAKPVLLRAGTNGWVCFASTPDQMSGVGNDPMCLDKTWQAWADAYQSKTPPKITAPGVAYMLRGDKGVSNTDPFATKPETGNQWVTAPGHIMLLFPDPKALDGMPTDPTTGGPWVMWKGTPYAHLMVPVAAAGMAKMGGAMPMPASK